MKVSAPIVVVAPFSPIGSGDIPALGAAKKIASVIGALATLGREVVLVNSAHNAVKIQSRRSAATEIRPGLWVRMITLPTACSRPIGKAMNLLFARRLAMELVRELGEDGASLLWIYNGYAFESRFALEFMRAMVCPLVVELEDMPFARRRPGNLKPLLDDFFLRRILPEASLVTCVNETMPRVLGIPADKTVLLPGLVDDSMKNLALSRRPFSDGPRTAGYFGNLAEEKGADLLLRLFENPPAGWTFTVTGTGPLAESFSARAKQSPELVRFTENASDAQVVSEMLRCDVILNPHRSIAGMGDGVFPFKVVEGLASRRLVISTPLPSCGLNLEECILFIEDNVHSLSDALNSARDFYHSRSSQIDSLATLVSVRHSEAALAAEVGRRCFPIGT